MKAVVKQITLPAHRRVICVSDIHGHLQLFEYLLEKVGFTAGDILILLGGFYTKGPYSREMLKRVVEMSRMENVHILRGNCDWVADFVTSDEKIWLDALPHVIDAGEYIFVHAGLPREENLDELDEWDCMRRAAFLEDDLPPFTRWVITGHWPTYNYCHRIPCHNPIVNKDRRIIAIDGGCVINGSGQLNAFIIDNGKFSYQSADFLPPFVVEKSQPESGGTLNITWLDRAVEMVERGAEFSAVRHIATGIVIEAANDLLYTFEEQLCANGTDYLLPAESGETVSLIHAYSDRVLAKKNGVVGWIMT